MYCLIGGNLIFITQAGSYAVLIACEWLELHIHNRNPHYWSVMRIALKEVIFLEH